MQRLKNEGLDPSKPDFSMNPPSGSVKKLEIRASEVQMTKPGINRKISVGELQSARAKKEAWFIVKGEVRHSCDLRLWNELYKCDCQVYQGKGFFNDHPGGAQSIEIVAGEDVTEDFMAIHSSDAKRQLADFHIGTLDEDVDLKQGNEPENENATRSFLNHKKWKKIVLANIMEVSKDAKMYRFTLENKDQKLGLPFGQHVYIRLRRKVVDKAGVQVPEGDLVQRAYTPLSTRDDRGFIDMLIK